MQKTLKMITRRASLFRANRSGHMRVVIASQAPSLRYNAARGTTRQEVLLLSGATWRTERRQLPLVDCGNRDSVSGILGSIRNCTVEHGTLVGNLFWARDKRSQEIARKIRDGHELVFSVDAQPLEVYAIRDGQTHRGICGPCDLILRWTPLSVSVSI